MQFYGPKFLKKRTEQLIQNRRESREGIVYNVYPDTRRARIRLQGSSEYVYCDFPANWKEIPAWLRIGQAVRLRHTMGARGRLELESHSTFRPTLQSGDEVPQVPTPEDTVMSGLLPKAIPGEQVMKVYLTAGIARFDGTSTSTIYISMSSATEMEMGYSLPMGEVAEVVAFDAAPAEGLVRYDRIVLGDDLVFDVVKGTAASSPELPDIPADHISCGWVMIIGGTTYIPQSAINTYYSAPKIALVELTSDDYELDWESAPASCTLTATAYDQYGSEILNPAGWLFTVEFVSGNGTITNNEGLSSTTSLSSRTANDAASVTFTYTRDQLLTDESPTLQLTIADYEYTNATTILLYDEYGDIM